MAFRNPPIAGSYLVRPAIQSPNYVLGSAGWTINRDGTAEFNGGTFRGSLAVGTAPGARFIVNNSATTDVLDIYNSSNKLVFSIDNTGRLVATSSVSTAEIVIAGANLLFEDSGQTPIGTPLINGQTTPDSISVNLFGGRPQNYTGSGQGAFITLSTGDTTASEYIAAEQRGFQGTLVQTDFTGTNQLVHGDIYSGTVAGGAGLVTFNHGCSFTPISGVVAPLTNFSQWNWHDAFGVHGFSNTQAQIMPFFPGGASLGNGQVITFAAWFWG